MRIPLIVAGVIALLWPFSYYQLVVYFWPYLIHSVATGERSRWYDALYPVFTYIYLFGPFVFASALLYAGGLWFWRMRSASNADTEG